MTVFTRRIIPIPRLIIGYVEAWISDFRIFTSFFSFSRLASNSSRFVSFMGERDEGSREGRVGERVSMISINVEAMFGIKIVYGWMEKRKRESILFQGNSKFHF